MDIKCAYTRHWVMYYPKFHCKLNHIKYLWYNRKSSTRRYCKYAIDGLKEDVSQALSQIKSSTISGHYNNYLKKMDLYKKKLVYGTGEWKKLISHKKI